LQFSVVLRPGPQVELSLLTTAVGLACADAVEEVAEVAPRLKWPNDVTVAGRKLAGILVESESTASGVAFAIAGVGVNTDWPRDELPTAISDQATSLRFETARPVSRARLLAAILARLRARYESLSDAAGRAAVVADAAARSELLGREVVVTLRAGRRFTGRARALADWGGLEVETPEGMEVVETAEVELVRDR
jgi:BirA family transcriptional regulator, biotin operon repressor / biotin---[acetyl-CoA-carboxylase] ligase